MFESFGPQRERHMYWGIAPSDAWQMACSMAGNKLGPSSLFLLTGDGRMRWTKGVNRLTTFGRAANGMWPSLKAIDIGEFSACLLTDWPALPNSEPETRMTFGCNSDAEAIY